ncbi:COR domain-containing protein [Flavobacterium sasangense]|uniref:COR domain-containing protein n=1 Tax=Flavobacterium sasangense TaxID=503361 RepID=UPI00047B1BC8|nr:COR domain-containing protein [Flavobacterium sasangense]
MSDIQTLIKIENKLQIKFGNYEDWQNIRKSKQENKNNKSTNETIEHNNRLESQQLVTIDKQGKITEIFLNGIELTEIPEEVFELKNLKRFDCVNNRLTSISTKFSELSELNTIFLFSNKIEEIPEQVIFHKSLKKLEIHDNPIKTIPPELFEGNIRKNTLEAIRNYLNSLKAGTKNLNEVKVIIVGDGGAGKTSLQKLLTNEDFNPQESQTHGINIKHLTLRPNKKNVKYRLWDFGGQEIMHATHQFFLSRRSIYIILLNAREEPNPEYWLNHIKSFGGNSPVLVVINKTDENPAFDINRLFLKEKYPNIIDFIKISCANGVGIESVKTALKKSVLEIKDLNSQWALSWFKVKTILENMSSSFISYDEFTNLCHENGVYDASSQNTLVEYLNDLGIILHFKDFELSDTHVLDPEWVTYAVYKIINSKKLADNKGLLKLSEIKTILNSKEGDKEFKYPSSTLNYIIELMMKFELCYKVSNSEILVPDLLEVQEPLFKPNDINPLKVIISYGFLPKSIMPRLIVNLHNDIFNQLRWRTGLIVYDKSLEAYAKITVDYESKNINIEVFGDKKRDYLSIILFIIRKINSSFKGLENKINIPVKGAPNVTISHSHLLTLESKGITKYIPEGLDYEVNVKEMLGTIQSEKSFEEEIFALLDKLVTKADDNESIAEKANEIIQMQPNFFGMGININALVKRYLKK